MIEHNFNENNSPINRRKSPFPYREYNLYHYKMFLQKLQTQTNTHTHTHGTIYILLFLVTVWHVFAYLHIQVFPLDPFECLELMESQG